MHDPEHPGLRRETLGGTLANDGWARLIDLLGLPQGEGVGVPEGTLQPQGFGIVLRAQAKTSPAPVATGVGAVTIGIRIAADQPFNMGPTNPGQCIRLDEMWVRNLTPGSNATVVFMGQLCREA
jgi:hypothetical protein